MDTVQVYLSRACEVCSTEAGTKEQAKIMPGLQPREAPAVEGVHLHSYGLRYDLISSSLLLQQLLFRSVVFCWLLTTVTLFFFPICLPHHSF